MKHSFAQDLVRVAEAAIDEHHRAHFGEAKSVVAAVLKGLIEAGWTPPGEPVAEHAVLMPGGGMHVRASDPEVERVYPLAQWVPAQQRHARAVFKRRIVVVEDWTEVPRG